jgi:hypothetical protein
MEIDFDFGLGFNGLVVDIGGLVAPFANGFGDIGEEGGRSVKGPDAGDAPFFVDGSLHGDSAVACGPRDLRVETRGKLAQDYFFAAAREPPAAANPHGTLNVHGHRGGLNHALTGKIDEGVVAVGSEFDDARSGMRLWHIEIGGGGIGVARNGGGCFGAMRGRRGWEGERWRGGLRV